MVFCSTQELFLNVFYGIVYFLYRLQVSSTCWFWLKETYFSCWKIGIFISLTRFLQLKMWKLPLFSKIFKNETPNLLLKYCFRSYVNFTSDSTKARAWNDEFTTDQTTTWIQPTTKTILSNFFLSSMEGYIGNVLGFGLLLCLSLFLKGLVNLWRGLHLKLDEEMNWIDYIIVSVIHFYRVYVIFFSFISMALNWTIIKHRNL